MIYREAKERAAGLLGGAGIEDAEHESRLLMEFVKGTDLNGYLLHAKEEMPGEERERFFSLVRERCRRVPLQYLTGEQDFMGCPIRVDDSVLIPRQDTELLAREAIRILRAPGGEWGASDPTHTGPPRVLDLCTGSGCIAIALAAACPFALVFGSDLSAGALAVAEQNGARNGVQIEWIASDLFASIDGVFDLIVSNPPYIPTGAFDSLMPEVRDHEPRMALDGGSDGLSFYREILRGYQPHLAPGGVLLFEIGSDEADAVSDLMRTCELEEIRILKDLAGLNRVAAGRRRFR